MSAKRHALDRERSIISLISSNPPSRESQEHVRSETIVIYVRVCAWDSVCARNLTATPRYRGDFIVTFQFFFALSVPEHKTRAHTVRSLRLFLNFCTSSKIYSSRAACGHSQRRRKCIGKRCKQVLRIVVNFLRRSR